MTNGKTKKYRWSPAYWQCQECGRKFRTTKAAERAVTNGCSKCGSVDIDLSLADGSAPACPPIIL